LDAEEDAEELEEQIKSIKDFYGIKEQKLESLLKSWEPDKILAL